VPPWLPKTRLWFGLERFGLEGLAAVIEARIQELGGGPTVESVSDRAARLQRSIELKETRQNFRDSDKGVRDAKAAFQRLITALEARCAEVAAAGGKLTGINTKHLQITIRSAVSAHGSMFIGGANIRTRLPAAR
jgi:hypothetical protein